MLGTLIGAERQYRQRTAGLRTNVLVAVGAAAFVDLAMHLTGADGAVRVIAYVVSGIGFLGAGVIMKQGMDVRGLNTAATLWASAAVGSCAGADMVAQAAALTVFVLAGNTMLRPLVNAINRIPLDEKASEATYYFKLAVDARSAARHARPPGGEAGSRQLSGGRCRCGRDRRRSPGDRGNAGRTAVDPNELECGGRSTCSISPACATPPGK